MPGFRAIVRFTGLDGKDSTEAHRALEHELRTRGLVRWRILDVEREGIQRLRPRRRPRVRRESSWRREGNVGGLLLVGALAWAIWLFWVLVN